MKWLESGVAQLLCLSVACFAQAPAGSPQSAVKEARERQARGDLEGVVRALTPWVETGRGHVEAQHLLGLAYYQQQNFAGAIRHLSTALKMEQEGSAAWKQTVETLAMAYYFSNRSQEALPLLEKAAALNPGDTYFPYALAMTYVYLRDLDAARRAFARLFDIRADDPQAFLLTSHFLAREKFGAEAGEMIREAQKKRPDLPDLDYRLGLIALTDGDLPEAVKRLEKELERNPIHPMAWHYLGDAYIRLGKTDLAIRGLQRAIWLNLRATESYILIANAYTGQGKYLEAEQALQRALELAPQSYEARFALARIYHKTNRPELATKEMAIANKLRAGSEARE